MLDYALGLVLRAAKLRARTSFLLSPACGYRAGEADLSSELHCGGMSLVPRYIRVFRFACFLGFFFAVRTSVR